MFGYPGLSSPSLQLNEAGKLKHLLTLEGLKQHHIRAILARADQFIDPVSRQLNKQPLLKGKTIVNLFLKPQHAHAPPSKLLKKASVLMSSTSTLLPALPKKESLYSTPSIT